MRLRFSLKHLLIFVALLALPFGWIGYQRRAYRHQWDSTLTAISQWEAKGGTTDWHGKLNIDTPIWYRRLLGDRFFECLYAVEIFNLNEDEDLAPLSELKNLHITLFRIDGGEITGSGFVHLKALPHLRVVRFDNTSFSQQGWRHLGQCSNVTAINISGPSNRQIGEAELAELQNLKKLEHLALENVRISQQGCSQLAKITSLIHLDLQRTKFPSGSCADLAKLPDLEELWLSSIDDADLENLPPFPSLRSLFIHDSQVRGPGLKFLSRHPRLESVLLGPNNGSPQEIQHLESLGIKVHRW